MLRITQTEANIGVIDACELTFTETLVLTIDGHMYFSASQIQIHNVFR